MDFFLVEPEVAGSLGEHSELDTTVHPPRVHHLHYEFADWLGDDLLETFPCFVVTEKLAGLIHDSTLGSVAFAEVEVSVSPEGTLLTEADHLPAFKWMQVTGRGGVDDFGVTAQGRLVVSDRALTVLRVGSLDNALIESFAA